MIDQYLKPNVKRGALYYGVIVAVIGILRAIPVLGCLFTVLDFCIGPILALGTGYLVAQWGATSSMAMAKTPLAVQSTSPYTTPAIDGAVGAGVGSLIGGIVGWIAGIIVSIALNALGVGLGTDTTSAAFDVIGGAIARFVGLIFAIIFALILGAVGGALYVIMSQRKTATPSTPA